MAIVRINKQNTEKMSDAEFRRYFSAVLDEIEYVLKNIDENNLTKTFKERVVNGN